MTNGQAKERVGIVGAGRRMGHAMLKHLVKHGYSVTALRRQRRGARECACRAGAATADTPAALAKACDFVILGVGYTDEVRAVVYGDGGLIANLPKSAIICGVLDHLAHGGAGDRRRRQAERASACSTHRSAAGGSRPTKARCWRSSAAHLTWSSAAARSIGCFCSDYAHLGNVGHGQVGKTMNNLLLWISAVGLIEAGGSRRPPASISSSCATR
jgi:hypothetical protein